MLYVTSGFGTKVPYTLTIHLGSASSTVHSESVGHIPLQAIGMDVVLTAMGKEFFRHYPTLLVTEKGFYSEIGEAVKDIELDLEKYLRNLNRKRHKLEVIKHLISTTTGEDEQAMDAAMDKLRGYFANE